MDSNGPDQLLDSDEYITNIGDGAVLLRFGDEEIIPNRPISIPTVMKRTALKYPKRVALAEKQNGKWEKINFKEYRELVLNCAKAFIKLGLPRFHSVCVMGFNSPEWMISCLAAIHAGGFACGIYATNSAETARQCIDMSLGSIAVVEDATQVLKVLSIKDTLPNLLKVIQYKDTPEEEGVLSWDALIDIGKNEPDSELEDRLSKIAINQCAQLVFTSGTTGEPKAVMLSHDNILSCTFSVGEYMHIKRHEKIVSYLPLSHVAAAAVDIYLTLAYGGSAYFASKDVLKGGLAKTLLEVRPTRFLGVPRVYEKLQEKLNEAVLNLSNVKKVIFHWASSTLLKENMNKINGLNTGSIGFNSMLSRMVLRNVKYLLGFNKCKSWINAAAPLSPDVIKYFLSIDIPISAAYGLSETTGAHTLNLDFKYGSVGRPCPGMYAKLNNVDRYGEGEILLNGRDICMGYMGPEKFNNESFDEDGWFITGDIGKIDLQGFLYISGRVKELIITAGGENVAPVPIENRIKNELPIVNYVIVIGDQEKFLSVLLTIKRKMDFTTGLPSDELDDGVIAWCRNIGSSAKTIYDILIPDSTVHTAVSEAIDRANMFAISRAQIIQKYRILPTDFSLHTGELGPTLKLKRTPIIHKYQAYIDDIYGRRRSSSEN